MTNQQARQEVFDELADRMLSSRANLGGAAVRKVASELIQLGWDLALNTDDLCNQYGESLKDANEAAL